MLVREQDAPRLHDGLRLPGAAGLQQEARRSKEGLRRRHGILEADVTDRLPARSRIGGVGGADLARAYAALENEPRRSGFVVQTDAVVRRLHGVSQLGQISRGPFRPPPLEAILMVGRAFPQQDRGPRDLASGSRYGWAVAFHSPAGENHVDEEEV